MSRCRRQSAHDRGVSAIELVMALAVAGIVLATGTVSVSHHVALRDLRGTSDAIVADLRGAQQLAIARRAITVVTFTSRLGTTLASYTVSVGGVTVRRETLPLELDVTAAVVSFNSLGASLSALPVNVTILSTRTSRTRTVTVAGVSGVVAAAEP